MLDDALILAALRGDRSVAAVCEAAGATPDEFRRARDVYLRRRLPPAELRLRGGIAEPLDILRDRYGVPHIYARTTPDLYYGLGLAMAQDRLWQMDLFRRRGLGRLAEVLGPAYLGADVTHRTLALDRIAAREVELLDEPIHAVLGAFVAGVNRAIEVALPDLPIEFHLLGYEPEPWTARDVIAALRGFWWSLNGRLQSLAIGEAARYLPEGPLREAFLTPEFPEERIVPPGSPYPPAGLAPAHPAGGDQTLAGAGDGATGSNNWAVGRGRSRTGAGVLGSDPHQPFMLPSNWYECRLSGPDEDTAGAAWTGAPGVWFGRNRQIAWGLTNNNASTRDLYVEDVDPADPGRYRDGADWRPFGERMVEIAVRGQPPERLTVRETVRGPIVNHLVPPVDPAGDPPLSLRWIGQEHVADVRALLAVGRARDWEQFRAALADWAIPTFNWVYADVDGHVGYQCASRLPLRGRVVRGFRQANNPDDRWLGYVPFDAMPRLYDPDGGFVATANNAPVADDYPYPFYGAFASGERALRIRETIAATGAFDRAASEALQHDTRSPRAERLAAALRRRLGHSSDPDVRFFCRQLAEWDYHYDTAATAPVFFEMFLRAWSARVAGERFPAHLVPLVAGQGSVAARLLEDDELAWFQGDKGATIVECARQAVGEVRARFGPDPAYWAWGAVHQAHFRHPLANPATADAFDVGPHGVAGAANTVRNTGLGDDPLFGAAGGAEYRLVADLADPTGVLATQNIGQSGQPGSPHYADQYLDWVHGRYHIVSLDRRAVEAERTGLVHLEPGEEDGR